MINNNNNINILIIVVIISFGKRCNDNYANCLRPDVLNDLVNSFERKNYLNFLGLVKQEDI